MSSVSSLTVVQYNNSGSQLLATDTGSYTNPIVSRVLTMYDYAGNQLQQFNMGTNLTQVITISQDGEYTYILAVTDNTGVVPPVTVNAVAFGFYTAAYLLQFTSTNCGCQLDNCNLDNGELNLNAAFRFNLAGNLSAAQTSIILANYFVNLSPVVQYV